MFEANLYGSNGLNVTSYARIERDVPDSVLPMRTTATATTILKPSVVSLISWYIRCYPALQIYFWWMVNFPWQSRYNAILYPQNLSNSLFTAPTLSLNLSSPQRDSRDYKWYIIIAIILGLLLLLLLILCLWKCGFFKRKQPPAIKADRVEEDNWQTYEQSAI